jgi:hypothetical protein
MSVADQLDLVVWIPSPTGRQSPLQEAILRQYLRSQPPA